MGIVKETAERESDDRYIELRRQVQSLTSRLSKEKNRTAELKAAARDGWEAAASGLILPKLTVVKSDRRIKRGTEEVCVPLLSDIQLGKATRTYRADVALARVHAYAEKIKHLTGIQREDHPVKKMHAAWIGDFVEGETIFPGQTWLLDISLQKQVGEVGVQMLMDWILTCLNGPDGFETIEIDAVDGNHGRIGRRGDHSPETNADRMLYENIKRLVEWDKGLRDRVTINLAHEKSQYERNWYTIMQEGDYSALLIHGDQIRGNGPWHGVTLAKKVNGWASGGLKGETFTDVFMGHYHQCAMIPLNHRKIYCNGSTESDNDFARETLSAQSDPKQWLLFVKPSKGRVTVSYDVDLLETA